MRVCFIGGARYSQPLDTTSRKKFEALQSVGDLFVIGFSRSLSPRQFKEYARFYLLPLLPLPVLRHLEIGILGLLLLLWLIWRENVRTIVTQSPYEGLPAVCAKTIVGWFGVRIALIVESHGDFERDFFLQRTILFPNVLRWLTQHIARFVLNHADVLRSISRSTTAQLRAWQPDLPIVQFMAWTDIEAFLRAGEEPKQLSPPIFLYSGVTIPRKGVHHLVNAFAVLLQEYPDIRLHIVGKPQDPPYVRLVRELVQQHGIEHAVQFVAEVSQQDLAHWMAQASVFVLPSLSEGLGRVVIEAMAAGTPVIGSQVGGIPDMLQDGCTGFLTPPGDETALAEKMRWCLEHPEETKKMGQQARAFAQEFFSAQSYAQGYTQLFAEAAANLRNCKGRTPKE